MTISTLIRKTIAAGNGVLTSFNFNFQVRSASDLQVYYTDATNTVVLLASNLYTVNLNAVPAGQLWANGGSVTYSPAAGAIAAGTTLTIVRTIALLQSSSLINQGGYYPNTVEQALDLLTMEMQQLSETISRSLTLPVSSTATATLPFPLASAALGWDPTGTFITNLLAMGTIGVPVSVAQGGTGSATAVTARVALGVPTGQNVCQGRLTLTTALAVTVADVTGANAVTIFFTPYQGNQIATYNGVNWTVSTFAEKSIAVPATTATMYDVFIVDGTLALEVLPWTNDTTRATALTFQDGILVKLGATTRRYLGSFRTAAVAGQTEDSLVKRFVWNNVNRVIRPMRAVDTTDSWTYSTSAWRQANANTANQLDFVLGLSEDQVAADVVHHHLHGTALHVATAGIGLDVTNGNNAITFGPDNSLTTSFNPTRARYVGFPGIGRHFLAWVENAVDGVATQSWFGDNGTAAFQSGITGELRA